MTIGSRIRQRRLNLGYSLDDVKNLLAENGFSISKTSLSKYELDKSIPKAHNLYNLSRVLGVSSDYFLKNNNFEINWIAFRKTTKLPKREEERIKSLAKEQVEAYFFLNDLIRNETFETQLPRYKVSSLDTIEKVTEDLRKRWKLFQWPIESITSLFEDKGIFVVHIDSNYNFDGLSGTVDKRNPIVITFGEKAIDRKRFNLAHELGHLVLEAKNIDEEKTAFRFAGAFLIQKDCLFKTIGKKRRNIDLRELKLLKEEFGISIQALIRRCFDLNIISLSEFRRMNILMRAKGLHIQEPGMCFNKEVPVKVKSKLFRAISEGLTTESEVFSRFPLLSKEINEEYVTNNWNNKNEEEKNKLLEESAKKLLDDYRDGGSLRDFDAHDNVMEM